MLGDTNQSTPSISKTLNPEWFVSFDLPILGPHSLLLQAICWDKDRFGKDYMGEFDVLVDEIFANGQTAQEVGLHAPSFLDRTAHTHFSPSGTRSSRGARTARRRAHRYLARFNCSSLSWTAVILKLARSRF